jgi:hypothetical protein
MIPGDDNYWDIKVSDDLRDDAIEQANDIGWWHRTVVSIAGDNDCIHARILLQINDLPKRVRLVFQQRNTMEIAAQIPVGRVDESHPTGPILVL